jgi:exodeoxyribonuclease-3
MIVVTWNVNSIKVRLPNVLQYLKQFKPDILALQETKTLDENFPEEEIKTAGYNCYFYGQKTYNGVAILANTKCKNIEANPVAIDKLEARSIALTYGDTKIINVYVVNGQDVGTDKYLHKLSWLKKLHSYVENSLKKHKKLIILGDFNIAPTNDDVFDIEKTKEQILCSTKERAALAKLLKLGLYDIFNDFNFPAKTFSWWDYRGGAFHRNIGYRIDLILGSKPIKTSCSEYIIDKETRHKSWCSKEPRTSDHAPVRIIVNE